MGHFVHVTIIDDVDHLGEEDSGIALGEISLAFESAEELIPFAIAKSHFFLLKHHEEVVIVFEGFVDLDDLRVIECCQERIFGQNAARVFDELLLNPLDGSHSVGVALHLGLVDSGEGPPADDLANSLPTSWIS